MTQCLPDPTLNEALSDSITRAVMAADGVDPSTLAAELTEIARELRRRAPVPPRDAARWSIWNC